MSAPAPGKHADDDADDVAAGHLPPILLRQLPLPREDAAEPVARRGGRCGNQHVAHHLGHREHADQRRHDLDPAEEIGEPEGEAGDTARILHADAGDEEPEQHAGDRLHGRGSRHQGCAHEPEQGEPEILVGGEVQGQLGEDRRHHHERDGAGDAADRAEPKAGAEGKLRLAVARHGVSFIRIRRRGGGAGDAEKAARDIAGKDRHGRGRDDRGDGGDRRQVERHRHQECGGHGGRQPGKAADDETVDRCSQDRDQDVRSRDKAKGFEERAHDHQGRGTRPTGKGTRSSL